MQMVLWPFQLGANGRVVTADDSSDEMVNSRLNCLMQTRPGERALAQGFGTPDPVNTALDPNQIAAAVAQFGPDGVEIVSADIRIPDDATQLITLGWRRKEA